MSDLWQQFRYGPSEDRLKLTGTAWLVLSLAANFGRSDLGGFVGLIAVLAVLQASDYLLRLFLVLAPAAVLAGVIHFLANSGGFWWLLLQLLHFVVQCASIWFAYQCYQDWEGGGGAVPGGEEGASRPTRGGTKGNQDPFQAYVPPQSQAHDIYQQPEQPSDGHGAQQQPAAAPPQNAGGQQVQPLL